MKTIPLGGAKTTEERPYGQTAGHCHLFWTNPGIKFQN
jgi:hypothetical protein